ncbi:MAG: universal stress protein [Thermoplasmata archaeon]|nr:universal stress protein [Thermoplasmata archaeon]
MIKKIVIPTDGYGLEDHVIRYVARAFPFADFYVISVINTYERGVQLTTLLYKEMKESAEKAVERGRTILEEEGIHNIKTRVLEGLPSKKIMEYAKKRDADLVALRVYSRKTTASAQRMGSTVKNAIKRCTTPILALANECEQYPIKNVLFTTDGTRRSERAKNFAILFSSTFKANLEVLYVMQDENEKEHAHRVLENAEWKASFLNVKVKKTLETGDVVKKILEHAKENDLVVMGTGRSFLFWRYIGHVTQVVCTHSPVPVLLVHCIKKRWEKRISRR